MTQLMALVDEKWLINSRIFTLSSASCILLPRSEGDKTWVRPVVCEIIIKLGFFGHVTINLFISSTLITVVLTQLSKPGNQKFNCSSPFLRQVE